MGRAKVRGGRKAHNKRIQKRNIEVKKGHWELEMLKKKIYEEAKDRFLKEAEAKQLEEQNKPVELKITADDGNDNS